jgi:hypothetical protein
MSLQYRVRGTNGIEWAVSSGDLRIGSIHKGSLSLTTNRATPWAWHFELRAAPHGFEHHGFARTFEDAMEAVERNWRLWLSSAGLEDDAQA